MTAILDAAAALAGHALFLTLGPLLVVPLSVVTVVLDWRARLAQRRRREAR